MKTDELKSETLYYFFGSYKSDFVYSNGYHMVTVYDYRYQFLPILTKAHLKQIDGITIERVDVAKEQDKQVVQFILKNYNVTIVPPE